MEASPGARFRARSGLPRPKPQPGATLSLERWMNMHPANLDPEIVLRGDTSVPLRDLLPHTDWPKPLDAAAL